MLPARLIRALDGSLYLRVIIENLKRTILIFSFIACVAVYARASTTSPPFNIKLVRKPPILMAGEKNTFTLEIKNKSDSPLTLSTLFAFSWSLSWSNPDGSGKVVSSGGGSKLIIRTGINPETRELTCKYLSYDKGDFITLPAKGSKQFDVVIPVPQQWDAASADVTIDFESKYDGSEVGIRAWTGKGRSFNLTIPVKRSTELLNYPSWPSNNASVL